MVELETKQMARVQVFKVKFAFVCVSGLVSIHSFIHFSDPLNPNLGLTGVS